MTTKAFQIIPPPSSFNEAPVKPRGGRTKRVYRCQHCGRIFKRSEHCARHERVHTNERPFQCGFCDRKYARKDLVKRHERTLHADAYRAAHPAEVRNTGQIFESATIVNKEASQSTRHCSSQCIPTSPDSHSGNCHSQKPPLTPCTEITQLDAEMHSDCHPKNRTVISSQLMNPVIYTDGQFHLPQGILSSLGQYSPPASLNELEQNGHWGSSPDELFNTCDPFFLLNRDSDCGQDLDIYSGMESNPTGELHSHEAEGPKEVEIDPLLTIHHNLISPESPVPSLAQNGPDPFDFASEDFHYPVEVSIANTQPRSRIGYQEASKTPFQENVLDSLDPRLSIALAEVTTSGQFKQSQPNENMLVQVRQEETVESSTFNFNASICKKICDDARKRMPAGEIVSESMFPSLNEFQKYFASYIECFHPHFPIIHLPSLEPKETPSPLFFAITSIGALYSLDRGKAKSLFALASTMSSYAFRPGFPITKGTPEPAPLWILQTRVLLSLCGIFSEKPNVVMRTVENLGIFAIDYRLRRSLLTNAHHETNLDWEEWVSRESSKRLLCGMFIVSNLISTTFGLNPGFSHTHDLDFEILDDEKLWNAQSAREWREIRQCQPEVKNTSFQTVTAELLYNGNQENAQKPYQISGFAALVVMHAVNTYMWSLLQCTQTLSRPSGEPSTLYLTLQSEALSTLEKCNQIISSVRGKENPASMWNKSEGPIMFNCRALLRIAYIRLVSNAGCFDRLTLLTDNADDVASAVKDYIVTPQKRGSLFSKSVLKAFEGFLTPIKIGRVPVRKTAALTWSIEHAVAGWDAALFLTKWVHTVELQTHKIAPDNEEKEILDQLKTLLTEVDSEYDGTGSLAAAVAHIWSTFLGDVWVWGVTQRMGKILEQLSIAYEHDYLRRFQEG